MIFCGPTGNMICGHVLDCAMKPLLEKLHDLDPQLYVKWNPKKLKKWGMWEVRRRPNNKSLKDIVVYGGNTYVLVDYIENNFENQIFDVPFLNYDIITKLKRIDTWQEGQHGSHYMDRMESKEASLKEKQDAAIKEDRRYALKQQKSMVRDLMDYTLNGGDPSRIANHWK